MSYLAIFISWTEEKPAKSNRYLVWRCSLFWFLGMLLSQVFTRMSELSVQSATNLFPSWNDHVVDWSKKSDDSLQQKLVSTVTAGTLLSDIVEDCDSCETTSGKKSQEKERHIIMLIISFHHEAINWPIRFAGPNDITSAGAVGVFNLTRNNAR